MLQLLCHIQYNKSMTITRGAQKPTYALSNLVLFQTKLISLIINSEVGVPSL